MKRGKVVFKFKAWIFCALTLFVGCTNDKVDRESKCYRVKLGINYCSPPSYSVLVFFDKPNSYTATERDEEGNERYVAAMSNFPINLHQIDSFVYIRFHFDEEKDQEFKKYPCTAVVSTAKYLMLDGISKESCTSIDEME